MKHLRAVNRKAVKIEEHLTAESDYVFGLQQPTGGPARPHIPMGCSLFFAPGWEVDAAGSTAGLCQPVERDLYDCYLGCSWPAQVPDHLTNFRSEERRVGKECRFWV